jgi:hypothetical protein
MEIVNERVKKLSPHIFRLRPTPAPAASTAGYGIAAFKNQ